MQAQLENIQQLNKKESQFHSFKLKAKMYIYHILLIKLLILTNTVRAAE